MRLLFAVPHFFDPAGNGRHGSSRDAAGRRVLNLSDGLVAIQQLYGRPQCIIDVTRGMTTAEMTRHLGISTPTVRDHVKALLAKVGVRSRAELVARIFAEHYVERLEADVDRTG